MTKQTKEDIDALRYYRTNPAYEMQEEIKQVCKTLSEDFIYKHDSVPLGENDLRRSIFISQSIMQLSVGVMVGALRWQDEKCLSVIYGYCFLFFS